MKISDARILSFCVVLLTMTGMMVLPASPVPVRDGQMPHPRSGRSTSETQGKGNLASLLTGVFVATKVLQEKILPRPNDISEDLLGDFWNSLDVLLQLNTLFGDEIVNQTAVNNSAVLGPFLTPVSTQLLSWIGARLNCTTINGYSRKDIDYLRAALKIYQKLQQAMNTLLSMASDQGLTDGPSETEWIRTYLLCSGTATNATVSVVKDLYPTLNVNLNC